MGMTPKEKKSRNNGFAHEKASSRIHPDGRSSGATLGNYGRRELDQVKYIATIEGTSFTFRCSTTVPIADGNSNYFDALHGNARANASEAT